MLVDGSRIRRKITREYEKARRDLDRARDELERFENEDSPLFSRWMRRQFGSVLTELRETEQRLHELEDLILDIETEMLFNGTSPAQAYAHAMDRRDAAAEEPPDPAAEKDDPFSQSARSSHSRPGQDDSDPFDDLFGALGGNKSRPDRRKSSPTIQRLKELYRALARRLHPDVRKEMTPQTREWWHQAQEAYEAGDVVALETILCLCEIEDAGHTEKTSLSLLQRMSAQLKKSLRQIKSQLATHRRQPAWNFARRTDLAELEATMRRHMNADLRAMKERLQLMESHIATLRTPPRRRTTRTRRRPASSIFDSLF